jgi:hypothetical protein
MKKCMVDENYDRGKIGYVMKKTGMVSISRKKRIKN